MTRMIDLHVHTTASDGTYSPSGVVSLGLKAGLAAIAITDHDTVGGVQEALDAAKGTAIEVVPGVELSVGDTDDIHIVGLYVNIYQEDFAKKMQVLNDYRVERNAAMLEAIKRLGHDVSFEELKKTAQTDNICRLHIANYLQQKGIVSDYRKAFKRFLLPESKTYVPMQHLSEREGIETILKSGGLPFLAHINYLKMSDDMIEDTVKRLIGYGLCGVEAFYSGYDKKTELLAHNICEKFGLLKSGGTDFHGARRRGVYLGTGKGNLLVPYEYLLDIKNKIR